MTGETQTRPKATIAEARAISRRAPQGSDGMGPGTPGASQAPEPPQEAAMSAYLALSRVGKSFTRGTETTEAVRDVSLTIAKGECVAIVGRAGCGKSTLLNIVAGLTDATTGEVTLEGRKVSSPGPERAVVVQNHALLPWLTVYENVSLTVDKVFAGTRSQAERHERTLHALDLVAMGDARDKRPSEISSGMRQRVGIARALALEPKVLLLDEPFGALAPLTRAQLQDCLMEIHGALGTTILMATRDADEAVRLADRVVLMADGPSARAGQVREILDIALPRPRERPALEANPAFAEPRAAVLKFLRAPPRVGKAA